MRELIAQAEALEWAHNVVAVEFNLNSPARYKISARAAELRAEAAAEQPAEPKLKRHFGAIYDYEDLRGRGLDANLTPPDAEPTAASAPPCNLPFERVPQHAGDPGFGPVPTIIPLGSKDPKHPSNQPQAEQPAEQGEPVAHLVIIKTADAGETKFFTAPSDPRGFPVYRDSKASLRQVQKLLRNLSFKDAQITQALECIHRALEGDDQDPRLAALEELLQDILSEAQFPGSLVSMSNVMKERIEAALGKEGGNG